MKTTLNFEPYREAHGIGAKPRTMTTDPRPTDEHRAAVEKEFAAHRAARAAGLTWNGTAWVAPDAPAADGPTNTYYAERIAAELAAAAPIATPKRRKPRKAREPAARKSTTVPSYAYHV